MDKFWLYTARILTIVLTLAGVIGFVIYAAPLIEALIMAALLAYLLAPAVRLLNRRTPLNRRWAVTIIYSLFLLLLAGIPTGLGAVIVAQYQRLETTFFEALSILQARLDQPIALLDFRLFPQDLFDNLGQLVNNLFSTVSVGSLNVLSGVTTNLLWAAVILISLYYFLQDGPRIKPGLTRLVPLTYQPEISLLLDEIDSIWSLFLRVQLLIFLILGILMALGTFLVIWLFQAELISFSPVGFILLLLLVYVLAQQVDNLWLRPRLLGQKLQLHPGVAFVGLIAGVALGGVLAGLLVLPTLATLKVLAKYTHGKFMTAPET